MKISELATRTGSTAKALRFYETAGLLPAPARAANGYRSYNNSAIGRIRFIKAGQGIGLSLAEIRTLCDIRTDGRAPCTAASELLDRQIECTTARISELRAMKRELQQLRDRAHDLDPANCTPESVCHVINPGPCDCGQHTA